MEFAASAPCKCILFGEHYVVYGAPALSVAIEPRNRVVFSDGAKGGGITMFSPFGEGRLSPSGKYEGVAELELFGEVAKKVANGKRLPSCSAEFLSAWKLKGVGTSASLCASFAAGLQKAMGKKQGNKLVFEAAQAGDLVAHGGRASGIDARTVVTGKPMIFRRGFDPPAFEFSPVKFALPKGCSLLLVDTNIGKRDGTSKMLGTFARGFGITLPPQKASDAARERVLVEYAPLWIGIENWLKKPTADELGRLMDMNHALLSRRKMSSKGIDLAVASAREAGAYGAKLTGGGGEGGAAIVLCDSKMRAGVERKILADTGFACYAAKLADDGARIDEE